MITNYQKTYNGNKEVKENNILVLLKLIRLILLEYMK